MLSSNYISKGKYTKQDVTEIFSKYIIQCFIVHKIHMMKQQVYPLKDEQKKENVDGYYNKILLNKIAGSVTHFIN